MREIVKCLNCGIVWQRIICFGEPLELTENLMYNCPKCGSNYYEAYEPSTTQERNKLTPNPLLTAH